MATKHEHIEQKLAQLVEKKTSNWKLDAEWRRTNRNWLKKSATIALEVLERLEQLGWSQKMLAEKMDTTPQYVSKLCKGQENLTLKIIAQLEEVLNIKLGFETPAVHDLTSHISVQMDGSFMVAIAELMNRTDFQYDKQRNQIFVTIKSATIANMQLKPYFSNSVKKEVEVFAISA